MARGFNQTGEEVGNTIKLGSLERKEKCTLVGMGYGRPWVDNWRPGP